MEVLTWKRLSDRGRVAGLCLAATLAVLLPSMAGAAIPLTYVSSGGQVSEVRWNLASYPSGIPYVLATDSFGESTPDFVGATELDAIRRAFGHWRSVPSSSVSFQELGTTKNFKPGPVDGVNVVGFGANEMLSRAGVTALTFATVRTGAEGGQAGTLTESDILFVDDSSITWKPEGVTTLSSVGGAAQLNLEEVASREIGHFCGLNVSLVRSPFNKPLFTLQNGIIIRDNRMGPFQSTALLYPYALNGSPSRNAGVQGLLTSDERAAITSLYPDAANGNQFGAIEGRVTLLDTVTGATETLCGAHVMAVQPGSVKPIASTITRDDGTYRISGLNSGSFWIYVEPSSPADLQGVFPGLSDKALDFYGEFYNNAYFPFESDATAISVVGGNSTKDINVQVVKTVPNSEVTYAPGGQTDNNGNPVVLKIEPDNTQEEATRLLDEDLDGLLAVNDTIQINGDIDFYQFRATREDVIRVEIFASRIGSLLDPLIQIYGPEMQLIPFATANNTAGLGLDARIIFTAPESGNYFVEVQNAVAGGTANHFYYLEIEKVSGRVPLTPLGGPTAVVSVPISDASLEAIGFTNPTFGHIEITELKVQFLDLDGDAGLNPDARDFLPPSREANARFGGIEGGFVLFNDNGPTRGVLDYDSISPDPRQDQPLVMQTAPTITPFGFGFEVTFIPEEPLIIPAERRGAEDATPDFHVVIQPSLFLHHGDDFQAVIPPNGIRVRNNNSPTLEEANLFSTAYPPPNERDKFTGDIVEFRPFTPIGGGTIGALSPDFGVIGLNLIGDPAEEYWVSQVELTMVGFSLHSLKPIGFWDFLYDDFQRPEPNPSARTLQLTDFIPLTNGVFRSGGFSLFADNDNLGTSGDGVPNFGLAGDFLIALNGTQRYEIIPTEEIPQEIISGLLPRPFAITAIGSPHVSQETFLAARDDLNITAFKVILPVLPQVERLVPQTNDLADGTLGADMFIALKTSNSVEALDVFLPYIQVEGVHISNNLSEVIQFQDPGRSTLVNGRSLRSINNSTNPSTNLMEVRPEPFIQFRDLVNPADPLSRGSVLGTTANGSPPLSVIGIDAHDYNASALVTHHGVGTGDVPSGEHIMNTGTVLNSLTVILDIADATGQIETDFILPVNQQSLIDPDLIDLPLRGIDFMVDDDTTSGDLVDNDNDGQWSPGNFFDYLIDEELSNGTDDDLDGLTDESDFGDGDPIGLNGQLDPTDDTIAYLHLNDPTTRYHDVVPFSQFSEAPVVTQIEGGSLQVEMDLRVNVTNEGGFAFDLIDDPLSIFLDAIFYRIDHRVLTDNPALPAPSVGTLVLPGPYYPHGFLSDYGDDLVALFDAGEEIVSYHFLTEIPNSNTLFPLQGPDFFVSVRAGAGAQTGESFSVRIPAEGLSYSFYRGPNSYSEDIRPASVPFSDFSSSRIRVGSDNVPPSLTFLAPSRGDNQSFQVNNDGVIDIEFDVEFLFSDPDNVASVDFYWDTDRIGLDGEPIPQVDEEVTVNVLDNDGDRELGFTFRFPEEIARKPLAEVYIYGVLTDDVNPTQVVYASTPIILNATSRFSFNTTEFLIADNIGQIFGTGGANINIPEYRQRTNIIRDIELTPAERGALFLHGFGDVVLRGDPGPWGEYVKLSQSVRFPQGGSLSFGVDVARDIEADWTDDRYYLLDMSGGVHVVGTPPTFPVTGFPLAMGDIFRDMELTPTRQGLQVLSGLGTIFPLGDAIPLDSPSFGMDLARDISLAPGGAYLLNAYGDVMPLGIANPISTATSIPLVPGSDVYRAIEVLPGASSLLVMDREGQVFQAGDILLGPNPVPDDIITTPPGIAPGDPIVFTPPSTVVTGELAGAFIDLEFVRFSQTGDVSEPEVDLIEDVLFDFCDVISREDLAGLLDLFADDFESEPGQDKTDVGELWRSFFDYFLVSHCLVFDGSIEISRSTEIADTFILATTLEIGTLNPSLFLFAPADEPTEVDTDPFEAEEEGNPFGGGEIEEFGPITIDQTMRFWESEDGRGWRMRIWDDDYTDGTIDRADRVLAERYYTKTRARSKREGEGTVFLREEDQLGPGSSHNSFYLIQFREESEAFQADVPNSPVGGWFAPLLNILWFAPGGVNNGAIDDPIPTSLFNVPLEFKIRFNTVTGQPEIFGGAKSAPALFVSREDSPLAIDQNGGTTEDVPSPAGWRFFDPLGITVDPQIEGLYESHLFMFDGLLFSVPDVNSSAYVVNLTQASDEGGYTGILPLEDDLDLRQDDGTLVLPNFTFFQKEVAVAADDYLMVTFRSADQGGITDRLFYAIIHIESVLEANEEGNNTYDTVVFSWRFEPATDFLRSFNAFKESSAEKEQSK